ncbi:MAG: alpha/beta hydrolase [Myxococcaceae bacterium]
MPAALYLALALLLLLLTTQLTFYRAYGSTLGAILGGPVLVLSDFTPHVLLVSVGVSLGFVFFGALEHPAGVAALGLHIPCWMALGLHLSRVHRTLPLLDGERVADDAPPFPDGGPSRPLYAAGAWLALLFLRARESEKVSVTRNLVYREVGGVRLRLDVYRPREPGPHPSVLYVHGGGWVVGHRRTNRFMLTRLAAAGWVVFAIAYRRPPRFPLPAAVVDCKAAVAWIREHGQEHGAAPSTVVLYGESAGGHLAALTALTPGEKVFQPGFEQTDTRVQGAMVFYGVTDLIGPFERRDHRTLTLLLQYGVVRQPLEEGRLLYQSLDPTSCDVTDTPPTLVVQGTADMMVPVQMSRRFCDRLRSLGARDVHLLEVPFASHAFDIFPSPLQERVLRVAIAFLERVKRRAGTPA